MSRASAKPRKTNAASLFPIVGIGASAGGLEAFTQLLRRIPPDTGMAFVLVQHLDPAHESELTHLLAKTTAMPTHEVTNDLRIEPGHVYVIPPNVDMTIGGGVLKLKRRAPGARGPHHSIDAFLESLAADRAESAIGVILSGTATDGTLGLEAIKAGGGITFAQDATAKYDSMPRNAEAAGCVDFVLSPEKIAAELVRIARHPYLSAGGRERSVATVGDEGAPSTARDRGEIAKILLLLRNRRGVDFALYKSMTLQRRIARRMMLSKHDTPAKYGKWLRETPGEVDALFSDILISVTSFFRGPEAFDVLQRDVFPRLLKGRRDDPLRAWVLGCSTGQEAYSICMAYSEVAERIPRAPVLQVFATDLNEGLLDRARAGLYSKNEVAGISPARLKRFFAEDQGGYRIVKALREMAVFAKQNLINDPPFSRMDLISCRNVLIYLEPSVQKKALRTFHYALKPGGYLLLGASESAGAFPELFDPIDKKHKLFSRKPLSAVPQQQPAMRPHAAERKRSSRPPAAAVNGSRLESTAQREADRVTVNEFAPPGVLINADLQIVQFRGPTAAYLTPRSGNATFDILKMARDGLVPPLRSAIDKAKKENRAVRKDRIRVDENGKVSEVCLRVIPLRNLTERSFLVLFEPAEPAVRPGVPTAKAARSPAAGRDSARKGDERKERSTVTALRRQLAHAERELAETHDFMRSIQEQHAAASEELQASNEEAQSANEELQSINEELETSKEELESTNEELNTVNEEMVNRNAELTRLNADLHNLNVNIHTAVVVLDQDMRIRRFTPVAEQTFNLLYTDIGRPFSSIRHDLYVTASGDAARRAIPTQLDLDRIAKEAMDAISPREHEVQDEKGRWYSLRIRPYMTLDKKVDGVVLVLVDIDELKRSAREVEDARNFADATLRAVSSSLLVLDRGLRVKTANEAFYRTFHANPQETEGRHVYELGGGEWNIASLRTLLENVLPHNKYFREFEVTHEFPQLGERTMLLSGHQLGNQDEERELIILVIDDISERKQAVEELKQADRRKDEFLATLAHELRNPLAPILNSVELLRGASSLDGARPATEMIERQVGHMSKLINDLLDVSRITRGRIDLQPKRIELASIMSEVAEAFQPQFKRMKQKLTVDLPPPTYLDADPIRLAQVLGNLLNNASKFTDEGGRISLMAERVGQDVMIRVRDTGVGVDKSNLSRIFDLFTQIDTSLERTQGGLGIGLTLVKRLVEMQGGKVEVRSDGLGHGSEFGVRFPVAAGPPEVAQPVDELAGKRAPRVVLIVDDNVDAAESLALLLRMGGHTVHMAHDGVEAVAETAKLRPDVVLLDIGLPKLNGYQVARKLRQDDANKGMALIALTGWGQEKDRQRSEDAGFDAHMVKPINFRALEKLVDSLPPKGVT